MHLNGYLSSSSFYRPKGIHGASVAALISEIKFSTSDLGDFFVILQAKFSGVDLVMLTVRRNFEIFKDMFFYKKVILIGHFNLDLGNTFASVFSTIVSWTWRAQNK